MLKKILAAVLAAQLSIAPVQAETKRECTKGFVGFDDFMAGVAITYVIGWLTYYGVKAYHVVKKNEAERAKQKLPEQPAADCKL